MGLRIDPGINLLQSQRAASEQTEQLQRSLGALASGLRINRAADDAAGLAIAEGFRAQVAQFGQESRALQDGLNLLQTADGGLAAQQDQAGRLQELAVQANNGTLTDEQRAAINEEAQAILQEIDATGANTEFNGLGVLDGDAAAVDLGTEAGVTVNVDASNTSTLGIAGLDLSTQAGAESALGALETAATALNENRAAIGAQSNRLEAAINTREEAGINAQASESAIRDLDFAREFIERTRAGLLQQSGIAGLVQGNLTAQNVTNLLS